MDIDIHGTDYQVPQDLAGLLADTTWRWYFEEYLKEQDPDTGYLAALDALAQDPEADLMVLHDLLRDDERATVGLDPEMLESEMKLDGISGAAGETRRRIQNLAESNLEYHAEGFVMQANSEVASVFSPATHAADAERILKGTNPGNGFSFWQYGDLVVFWDGLYDDRFYQYLTDSGYANGHIRMDSRGKGLDHGQITVTGAQDEAQFKAFLRGFSKKKVVFN